jgi:DNA-binding LytR/AlgR family response regulator
LHVGPSKYMLKETMASIDRKLDDAIFLRIHRSTIVNTHSVKEFQPFLRGTYLVLLKDRTKLFSSRRFHSRIDTFLQSLR